MVRNTNKSRRPATFNVNDYVWLCRDVLHFNNPSWKNRFKLSSRYIGPYKIVSQINPAAYQLELPEEMQLHPVFHVSELKPYVSHRIRSNTDNGEPLDEDDEDESPPNENQDASASQP